MKKITYLFIVACMHFSVVFAQDALQRVYLSFESPGFQREILLAFTPDNAATDGFDYGYDGGSYYNFPNDFSWIIEGERYVIQGVGSFDETKKYPLGVFLTYASTIKVGLQSTENFIKPIDIYIYDSETNTYFSINDDTFQMDLDEGNYENRFFLAFTDPNNQNLSTSTFSKNDLEMKYSKSNQGLILRSPNITDITNVEVFSILGQKIRSIFTLYNDHAILNVPNQKGSVSLLRIKTNQGIFIKKIVL